MQTAGPGWYVVQLDETGHGVTWIQEGPIDDKKTAEERAKKAIDVTAVYWNGKKWKLSE